VVDLPKILWLICRADRGGSAEDRCGDCTRDDELAPVPWDASAKETFLRMQFAAQDRS
jgi:hypothetical protein